jgi:hypothetical protein
MCHYPRQDSNSVGKQGRNRKSTSCARAEHSTSNELNDLANELAGKSAEEIAAILAERANAGATAQDAIAKLTG